VDEAEGCVIRQRILAGIILTLTAAASHAALLGRVPLTPGGTDYQAVYDTDLNITWLANANLAATNTFGIVQDGYSFIGANGYATGFASERWSAGMNAANYLGVSDWRLPSTLQPDGTCQLQVLINGTDTTVSLGVGCRGSEMGHLFFDELGGISGRNINIFHNANYFLFRNIVPNNYASGTPYSLDPTLFYIFDFNTSDQRIFFSSGQGGFLWPVRNGDIALATVPVPAAVCLLGSALGVLGWKRRKVCGWAK
jgi:hypothetical protein